MSKLTIRDPRITFLFNDEGARLELIDNDSNSLIQVKLNQKQVCQMLSRLGYTECESMEIYNLDYFGKKMENQKFEFELPSTSSYEDEKRIAIQMVDDECPSGWEADHYFSSQDSFFTRDGKKWARCTIRRWV